MFVELPLFRSSLSLKVEWFIGGSEHTERRPKKKMVLQLGGTTKVECIAGHRHSWRTPCNISHCNSGIQPGTFGAQAQKCHDKHRRS